MKHLYMHNGMCVGKEPSLNLNGVSAQVTHYFISVQSSFSSLSYLLYYIFIPGLKELRFLSNTLSLLGGNMVANQSLFNCM